MSELARVRLIVTAIATGSALLVSRWLFGSWTPLPVIILFVPICYLGSCLVIRPEDDD